MRLSGLSQGQAPLSASGAGAQSDKKGGEEWGAGWSGEAIMQDKLAAANSSTKLQGGRMQTKEPSTTQGSPAALLRSASPRARLILITMLVALAACLYYVTEPIRWKFVPELKQTAVDERGGVQTVSEDVKDTVTAAIIQEKNAAEGAKPTEIPTAVEQEDHVEEETAEEISSAEETAEETAEGGDAEEEAQAEAAEEQQEHEESQAAADVEEGQEGQEQATTEEEQEGQEAQDASEGAGVVTVDEASATDMLAPGEEPASHEEQEQVQEQQDDPNEDMSSSAESPEEVAGTNDGESVAGDEVVTADVSPEDSAEAMLSPSEAPTDVEQVAEDAESTNVEVAVTNAGEELSEAAHDAKSSLNAIDEATDSASKLAEDASSEDVQNIAEGVSATSGEVARVASEVLKATEEAKSTLQDVASGMATGDEENVEEDADKLEETAEKLQDAAIVAEDAADQAQQAATEAEKVAQRAEDDGDSTKMLEAEQAKEVATTAQVRTKIRQLEELTHTHPPPLFHDSPLV